MAETANIESVIKRYGILRDRASLALVHLQNIAQYLLPHRSNIIIKRAPGAKQTADLYDSTAPHANDLLAAALSGVLTSDMVRWFSLRMRNADLNEIRDVGIWLEDTTRRIYLALQQSNFSPESHEFYLDLGGLGTGGIFEEEGPLHGAGFSGLLFKALSPGEYVFDEDARGLVSVVFRKFELPAQVVKEKFGEDALSDVVRRKMENDKDFMVEILHAVMPREQAQWAKALPEHFEFASMYGEFATKHELRVSGFVENPYIIARWSKTSGELYGRGPGHLAYPTIKTLNTAVRLRLKQWNLAISPALAVLNDGLVGAGQVKLTPGAQNPVATMDAIKAIEPGAKFDVANMQEEQLRREIRTIFYNDRIQLPDKQYMTATEIERAYELMNRYLGPTIGRLKAEFLVPLINRTFGILLRAGMLSPIPPVMIEAARANEGNIDVQYEGPLARSQRVGDLSALNQTLQVVGMMGQIDPAVFDNYDFDEASRLVDEVTGLPLKVRRDARDVAKIRAGRQQGAQESAGMAQAEKFGGLVKNLAAAKQAGQTGQPAQAPA